MDEFARRVLHRNHLSLIVWAVVATMASLLERMAGSGTMGGRGGSME